MKPIVSGERSEDEGLFVSQHEYWVRTMRAGLEKEREQTLS
jgi:benzoate/toluate 1,2-dioxygenase alpha subunit